MSDATTPHFGFTLPSIGASQDTWGNKLNGNWTSIDNILNNMVATVGTGFLPLSGGTISGNLTVTGRATAANLTVSSTASIGQLSANQITQTGSGNISALGGYVNGAGGILAGAHGVEYTTYGTHAFAFGWGSVGNALTVVVDGVTVGYLHLTSS